jgi:hypothetical protein
MQVKQVRDYKGYAEYILRAIKVRGKPPVAYVQYRLLQMQL